MLAMVLWSPIRCGTRVNICIAVRYAGDNYAACVVVWGVQDGYFRLERDKGQENGECGILKQVRKDKGHLDRLQVIHIVEKNIL